MKNTLTRKDYLFCLIAAQIVLLVWFGVVEFRSIPNLTTNQSKLILASFSILILLIGLICCQKKYRNNVTLSILTLLPVSIYEQISYQNKRFFLCVLILFVLCTIVYLLIHSNTFKLQSIVYIVSFSIIVPMILMMGSHLIGFHKMDIFIEPIHETYGMDLLDQNLDVLQKIEEDKWEVLSVNEKMNVLNTIVSIEKEELGIPYALNVTEEKLSEGLVAQYHPLSNTIKIDKDYMNDCTSDEVVDSICHEVYHAYQNCLVELYENSSMEYRNLVVFKSVPEYKKEFTQYKDGMDEIFDYYMQTCECDARAYAASRVKYYQDYLLLIIK